LILLAYLIRLSSIHLYVCLSISLLRYINNERLLILLAYLIRLSSIHLFVCLSIYLLRYINNERLSLVKSCRFSKLRLCSGSSVSTVVFKARILIAIGIGGLLRISE